MPGVGQPAHLIQVHLAIVQGAVYDAVNAIDGGYQPYLVAPAADPSDSKDAAAATAAHEVLVGLKGLGGVPMLPPAVRGWLDPLYTQSLAAVPDGPAKTAGIEIGEDAASAMLAERADDGRFGTFQFTEGFDRWRVAARAAAGTHGDRRQGPGGLGRKREAVPRPERGDAPHRRPEPGHERRLRGGLQRGQGARLADEHDAHRRRDGRRCLLAGRHDLERRPPRR